MADLRVYIDFKSPYAYLALAPTRLLADELGITVDWLPFVLDIPSYLGSARLDGSGRVVAQDRNPAQWSGVRYAYYDCRRYANLRGMTLRGTEKIWDTNLAALGMLWARRQGDAVLRRYLDAVYVPFWKRELDLEDVDVVERVLAAVGTDTAGFRAYVSGQGPEENRQLQEQAFSAGIFGVPTYEAAGERFFGREHLPRIRWILQGKQGPAPDIAYELLPGDRVTPATQRRLQVAISPRAVDSYLALAPVFALAEALALDVAWYRLPESPPPALPDPADSSRGARHRRYRAANHALNQSRYLPPGLPAEAVPAATEALLESRGIVLADGMPGRDMSARGYPGAPQFLLGDEIFVGRQHLPLIRARIEAMSGPTHGNGR